MERVLTWLIFAISPLGCVAGEILKKMLQEGIARPHVMLLIIYVFAYIRSISWAAKPHFHAWNINIDFFLIPFNLYTIRSRESNWNDYY